MGHLGTIPVRLWTAAGERPAHWLKGLMVLPGHRNGPVGFFLLRQALAEVELALSVAVAPDARSLLQAAGITDLGALPNAVRVLNPARVLRSIDPGALGAALPRPLRAAAVRVRRSPTLSTGGGALLRAAAAGWTGMRGGTGGVHAVVLPEPRTGELSRLWARTRRGLSAAPSRDPASLRARYCGEGGYRLLGVYEGGVLAGFAAVRPPRADGDPRLGGARVATVVLQLLVFRTVDLHARTFDVRDVVFRKAWSSAGTHTHRDRRNVVGQPASVQGDAGGGRRARRGSTTPRCTPGPCTTTA